MVIVRVPKGDEIARSTALDAGASGLVIPHCESAEEVRQFVKEMYFRKSRLLLRFLSFKSNHSGALSNIRLLANSAGDLENADKTNSTDRPALL